MSIKVSVVVPVYNPGTYIEPCIDSLLRQTMAAEELELIFVDDGSTDETPARLDRLATEHPNVKVIHQENSGWPGRPRNVGTDAATGEYVQYVDQDDWLNDEALERLYAFGRANDSDIVIGKMAGIDRGVPLRLFERTLDSTTIHDSAIIDSLTPHKLFRRSLLVESGIRFPEGRRRLEDHVFVVACYFAARRISVLSDYVCYVHISRGDRGNAGLDDVEPRGYFNNLREALDVVDANTEPGPQRDRLHRRWLRVEMLGRLRRQRMPARDEAYQEVLFEEIRRIIVERFSTGVEAGLGPLERLIVTLIRRGERDAMLVVLRWEKSIRVEAWLTDARWSEEGLELSIDTSMCEPDGSPVPLTTSPLEGALSEILSREGLAALRPQLQDTTHLTSRVEVVAKDVTKGIQVVLQTLQQHNEEGRLRTAMTALLHVGAQGDRDLGDALWDLTVRHTMSGRKYAAPLLRSGPDVSLPPMTVDGQARLVVPFLGDDGSLHVDVGGFGNRPVVGFKANATRSRARTVGGMLALDLELNAATDQVDAVILRLSRWDRLEELDVPATLEPRDSQGPALAVVRGEIDPNVLKTGRWRLSLLLDRANSNRAHPLAVDLLKVNRGSLRLEPADAGLAPSPRRVSTLDFLPGGVARHVQGPHAVIADRVSAVRRRVQSRRNTKRPKRS